VSESKFLRPSLLPKLALCGSYRSEEKAGPAADRGTKLDELFRRAIMKENVNVGDLVTEDREALRWAIDTAHAFAGGLYLEGREDELRVEACGLTGTADALCADADWSADLKTGQMRNYQEQQAAYAVGFMDKYFLDEWTVYLLFCDLQEVVRLNYTREEAENLVRSTMAKALDESPATPNDYCGWCANRFTCGPRLEAVGLTIKGEMPPLISATSEQLREFVLRAKVVEDCAEEARDILKERLIRGEKVAGCSIVSKRGSRKIPPVVIERHLLALGTGDVLGAYGAMSESKLKEIWTRKLPDKPFPESEVFETPGSTYIRVGRPKQ
jgi:hypothetical protein